MTRFSKFIVGLVVVLLCYSEASLAENKAMYQMVEIMHRLKHFPSPAGKETLKAILNSKDASKGERIIAEAMLTLQHKAVEPYKTRLVDLMKDASSTKDEKILAKIVFDLDHRPSKSDKQKLKEILERLK